MDTKLVIDLTGRAADCVLRFRTIAFNPRPVLDIKSFKAAIAKHIRKVAKDEGNRFETPLADVVRYAGIAASRAVQSWNNVSDKENHVDRDWFRNCVCDLIGGAVSDIGHKAFEYNELNASEYIEPDDFDPFDVSTYSTDRRSTQKSSSSDDGPSYYGFPRGTPGEQSLQSRGEEDWGKRNTKELPLHHQITLGWNAINELAANRTSSTSTAKFIEATTHLSRKRGKLCSRGNESSDDDLGVIKHRAKRPRSTESSPTAAAFMADRPFGFDDVGATKKKGVKVSWTREEVELMIKDREGGQSWDYVHAVLPRHTRAACQKKYREVLKQKEKQETSTILTSPGSGSQGDAEEDVVDEDEINV